jgi:hypothetical protein
MSEASKHEAQSGWRFDPALSARRPFLAHVLQGRDVPGFA